MNLPPTYLNVDVTQSLNHNLKNKTKSDHIHNFNSSCLLPTSPLSPLFYFSVAQFNRTCYIRSASQLLCLYVSIITPRFPTILTSLAKLSLHVLREFFILLIILSLIFHSCLLHKAGCFGSHELALKISLFLFFFILDILCIYLHFKCYSFSQFPFWELPLRTFLCLFL